MAMTCTFGQNQKPTLAPERAEFGTCWKWRRSLTRQFVVSACHSWLWYHVSPLLYWKTCVDIPGSTQAEVATAGENALVVLYGGKQGEILDSLRYRRYYEKVATRGQQIQPQNLPPSIRSSQIPQPFFRSNSGSVLVRGCSLKTRAGSLAVTRWLLWPPIYRLLQSPCSRWSAATVQLTVPLQGAAAVSMD